MVFRWLGAGKQIANMKNLIMEQEALPTSVKTIQEIAHLSLIGSGEVIRQKFGLHKCSNNKRYLIESPNTHTRRRNTSSRS
jgi:hypothetical protein